LGKKILVIRFSSIGDIVLTTPVVRALHEQLGADVHFLTKAAFAPILQFNPHVSRVITLAENLEDTLKDLREQNYDQIIDLHHNLRTQRIKSALRKPATPFHKLNFQKWLLVRFGINRLPDVHIVDRYMDAANGLGIASDGKGLDFFIPVDKVVDVQSVFGLTSGSYVSIVTGAAHQTKCMTTEQMIRLCHLLARPVVLLGGKGEMEKADDIIRATKMLQVKNACGKLDILQSASVIQQSGVVITPDTGLMHIAAALGKPQVVVWGNTVPQFGMYPYYSEGQTNWVGFEQDQLKCRPCSKLGYPQCPKGHFRCMLDHDLEKIAGAALSLIS
jgi:ADP-heptose:LPS heptosyltransferase